MPSARANLYARRIVPRLTIQRQAEKYVLVGRDLAVSNSGDSPDELGVPGYHYVSIERLVRRSPPLYMRNRCQTGLAPSSWAPKVSVRGITGICRMYG